MHQNVTSFPSGNIAYRFISYRFNSDTISK